MFCKYCGASLPDDANFCNICGAVASLSSEKTDTSQKEKSQSFEGHTSHQVANYMTYDNSALDYSDNVNTNNANNTNKKPIHYTENLSDVISQVRKITGEDQVKKKLGFGAKIAIFMCSLLGGAGIGVLINIFLL